ncbi:MAG: beta-propeller domain-containing protein [Oscillospiraceae bacterium]|nr:beta-propeller domain-containing protein [Oscillospiraceae bacterium]
MKFEERLTELMNEVDVPDELSPQNIALMLKEKSSQSKMEAEHRNTKSAPSISVQRRNIVMRTAVATAACAVFAVGMWAYNEKMAAEQQLEAPIEYEAVSPESYDDFYDIYTGITLEQNGTAEDNSDLTIDETTTQAPVTENDASFGFIEYNGKNISESDVIKSDENYIYCLKDGILYIISKETMEVVSEIESDVNPPVEIYIEGDKVILVSSETEEVHEFTFEDADNSQNVSDVPADDTAIVPAAEKNSDGLSEAVSDIKSDAEGNDAGKSAIPAAAVKKNSTVDIYSVKNPENPVHIAAYKQNGSYTSSKIVDGMLYMVTAYSDYRVKPLDTQADLDSFVPAYYFNGEKNYVAAADIIVPSYANSTDYTVVSAINVGSDDITPTVKAVLGSSKNVYCSAETLYIAGVGRKDKEYTIISSFDLSDGGIIYKSSGSIEGAVFGCSMNEFDGQFRIATKITDETGGTSVSVYVLDETLTVVNGAGKLLPDGNALSVRFEESYARIIDENGETATVIDLSANPPTLVQSLLGSSAYLYSYSEDMLMGIGKSDDGGFTLTMYDAETGLALNGVIFGNDGTERNSAAFTDRRAVMVDRESGIIGVPAYSYNEFGTQNSYYVFVYDETAGFVQKGVIEYVDVDDSMIFLRGSVSGDTLYIMSMGRVISARLSDMKIIDYYEY